MILNLGCGSRIMLDALNVDIMPGDGVDMVVDLSPNYDWPWETNSIDGIYVAHMMEHVQDQEWFINQCLRVLKPGGFLRLSVPHSSSISSVGCLGHYRTYAYNTFNDYLARDFYMFGKAKFKTVEQSLNWWYEYVDWNSNVSKPLLSIIIVVNKVLTYLANLSPALCENLWCYWVGGFREVIWKGEKL